MHLTHDDDMLGSVHGNRRSWRRDIKTETRDGDDSDFDEFAAGSGNSSDSSSSLLLSSWLERPTQLTLTHHSKRRSLLLVKMVIVSAVLYVLYLLFWWVWDSLGLPEVFHLNQSGRLTEILGPLALHEQLCSSPRAVLSTKGISASRQRPVSGANTRRTLQSKSKPVFQRACLMDATSLSYRFSPVMALASRRRRKVQSTLH